MAHVRLSWYLRDGTVHLSINFRLDFVHASQQCAAKFAELVADGGAFGDASLLPMGLRVYHAV